MLLSHLLLLVNMEQTVNNCENACVCVIGVFVVNDAEASCVEWWIPHCRKSRAGTMLLPHLMNFWHDANHWKSVDFTLPMHVFIALLKQGRTSEYKQHPTLVSFLSFFYTWRTLHSSVNQENPLLSWAFLLETLTNLVNIRMFCLI